MPTPHKFPEHREPGRYRGISAEKVQEVLELLNDVHKLYDNKDQIVGQDVSALSQWQKLVEDMHEKLDDALLVLEEACFIKEDGTPYYGEEDDIDKGASITTLESFVLDLNNTVTSLAVHMNGHALLNTLCQGTLTLALTSHLIGPNGETKHHTVSAYLVPMQDGHWKVDHFGRTQVQTEE